MREHGYYGLTEEEVENLYHAMNILDDVQGILSDKIVELELTPSDERKSRRYEDGALNRAYKHIDYAMDFIQQTVRDLRKI